MSTARKSSPVSDAEIIRSLCSEITRITGVQLGEKQLPMVLSRLKKRMMDLRIETFQEYHAYFFDHEAAETSELVSILTTHHTYFFREFSHFTYLLEGGLKTVADAVRKRGDRTIRIWSAACSRGHEVYSLAMFIKVHLREIAPDLTFEILGTDIDPQSVEVARNGVYSKKELSEVPLSYLGDFWAKGTGDIAAFVKAKTALREHLKFGVLNLIQSAEFAPLPKFDIVFCRNVFIYFTPEQIEKISSNILNQMHDHGLFFVGISETLMGLKLDVQTLGPSIYVKNLPNKTAPAAKAATLAAVPSSAAPSTATPAKSTLAPAQPSSSALPSPMRVLCVDDSPSVLALLKKIFDKEHGFEVVGQAKNGIEAQDLVAKLKPDVVTLDIHMPEMDGVTYLEKNYKSGHPPVVIVSSVSRENQDLATRALELGASDYVEKPSLNQLNERADEIRTKLQIAWKLRKKGASADLKLDQEFARSVDRTNTESGIAKNAARWVFVEGVSDEKLRALFQFLGPKDPPLIFFTGDGQSEKLKTALALSAKARGISLTVAAQTPAQFEPGSVTLMERKKAFPWTGRPFEAISAFVFQDSVEIVNLLSTVQPRARIYADETLKALSPRLKLLVADQFPITSFPAISAEYFATGKKG